MRILVQRQNEVNNEYLPVYVSSAVFDNNLVYLNTDRGCFVAKDIDCITYTVFKEMKEDQNYHTSRY